MLNPKKNSLKKNVLLNKKKIVYPTKKNGIYFESGFQLKKNKFN